MNENYCGYSDKHKFGIIINYDEFNLIFTVYTVGEKEFNEIISEESYSNTNSYSSIHVDEAEEVEEVEEVAYTI